MLYALRAAAAMRRVVLFRWDYPHPLHHFFLPAGRIDWRPDGLQLPANGKSLAAIDGPVRELESGELLNDSAPLITLRVRGAAAGCGAAKERAAACAAASSPRWQLVTGPLPSLRPQTNRFLEADCAGCANVTKWSADAACLWTRTFRAIPEIEQRVEQHLKVGWWHGGSGGEGDRASARGIGRQLRVPQAAVTAWAPAFSGRRHPCPHG